MAQDKQQETQIASLDDYPDDGIYKISQNNQSLLLIIKQGRPYVIENKCGHFGVPLENSQLRDNEIVCPKHGISFDLDTGKIVNRPYENCDPIRVFSLKLVGKKIFLQETEA